MAAEPRAARHPGEAGRRRAVEGREQISLVRARIAAPAGRVDPERLERLPLQVALTRSAPGRKHLVLVAGPGAGGGDPRARRRQPLGPAGGLPLITGVLLAIAVRVAAAHRQRAAHHIGAQPTGDGPARQARSESVRTLTRVTA